MARLADARTAENEFMKIRGMEIQFMRPLRRCAYRSCRIAMLQGANVDGGGALDQHLNHHDQAAGR